MILTWQVIFGEFAEHFRWIWFLNTNILLHVYLKLEILQWDLLFLHFFILYWNSKISQLFHIYLNIWKFLFFERIFIGIYIYIYVKLKLVRGLTSFNFFRWISMRVYHWNRILENLIRIAMHEIILYPRGVLLSPCFVFYLSKDKKRNMSSRNSFILFIENFMI